MTDHQQAAIEAVDDALRAVPELNHPYGPMAESYEYRANRVFRNQGFGNPVRAKRRKALSRKLMLAEM